MPLSEQLLHSAAEQVMCSGSRSTKTRPGFIPRLAGDLLLDVKEVISALSMPGFVCNAEIRLRGHNWPFMALKTCHSVVL